MQAEVRLYQQKPRSDWRNYYLVQSKLGGIIIRFSRSQFLPRRRRRRSDCVRLLLFFSRDQDSGSAMGKLLRRRTLPRRDAAVFRCFACYAPLRPACLPRGGRAASSGFGSLPYIHSEMKRPSS
jgi:hypothetical protein